MDLWDIQETRLDTIFITLKNNLYLLQKGSSLWKMSISCDVTQIPAQEPFVNEDEATHFSGPFKLNGPQKNL